MPKLLRVATLLLVCGVAARLSAQYDKVAALGSDSGITPVGGPASAPPVETYPYGLPDLRPTGKLNDHLPKWLQFGLEERMRWEGSNNSGSITHYDTYLLNRFRFGTFLQPVSWFRIVAQVQDARPFFERPNVGPPNENRWDLKLAYAQIGDPEKQAFSIRVGRQEIDFNSTILANSEWRNQGRSYDGVVANVHVDRVRLGVVAASVVNPLDEGVSHHLDGNDVYGLYAGIDRVLPRSAIEPFVLWRVAPSVAVEDAPVKTGRLDEKAYGFRVRGREISHLDYRFELVEERGSAGPNEIRAWATTMGAGYQVTAMRWRPRVFGGFDYASGDKNPRDGIRNTFDTMYPTAHDRFGITDQLGWQNIMAGRVGASIEPHRRWSVTGQYLDFWLASATDAVYNSSGGVIARDPRGRSGRHIGKEVDFYTWYEVNREIHVGVGVGHLLPGATLAHITNGASYTYPYFAIEMLDGKRVH
ncbi:MAG TPA: alginate export family protein [Bryobacteraceae bacterium]|nr:alginate export family protein [Bryobacteraceae bacterium]